MAVYKISELIDSLNSAVSDGFEYVSVSEVNDEENAQEPDTLFLDYLISPNDGETDMIDAITLPADYHADLD